MDAEQEIRAIHLFAGAGGGILGGHLLGWRTVCAVEIEPFCREVLAARQNDGTLAPFPIWDDVRTFDGRAWRGCCDILCGGFPCQNISPLGDRSGIRGAKSCLWCEFARIIGEMCPEYVFIENSSDLVKLGLDVVLQDLAELGYDAEWTCASAAELGAPHVRDRIWILAKVQRSRLLAPASGAGEAGPAPEGGEGCETSGERLRVLADADVLGCEEHGDPVWSDAGLHPAELPCPPVERRRIQCGWWEDEPGVHRVADGVANHVDRLTALGNGQVPYVAAMVFLELKNRIDSEKPY